MTLDRKLLLIDTQGKVIFSNADPECKKCLEKCATPSESVTSCAKPGQHRKGKASAQIGAAYLCSGDSDLIASSKKFKVTLSSYSEMLLSVNELKSEIKKNEISERRRLIHNLSTLLAHVQQELYSIIPQQELARCKNANEQISMVKSAIETSGKEAATATLKILKNIQAIKSELNVFNLLASNTPKRVYPKVHKIHAVLRNVVSVFFQDFQEKSIEVIVGNTQIELVFDYELMIVALHHIFLNAVKYSLPNSKLYINFEQANDKFSVIIDMVSLEIKQEEKEEIFNENYSGAHARAHDMAGSGVGLSIAKRLIGMNGASIYANPGPNCKIYMNRRYAPNQFVIDFPSKLLVVENRNIKYRPITAR